MALIGSLIDSTQSAEPKEVYVTKLALSVGRCILRPQYETDLTIGDRTPSLFLADLINHYADLFPPLVEKKKKESDRVLPVRKRTALVDQRISRSRLGEEMDPQQLLEQQHALAHPSIPLKAPALGLGTSIHDEPAEQIDRVQPPIENTSAAAEPPAVSSQTLDKGKAPERDSFSPPADTNGRSQPRAPTIVTNGEVGDVPPDFAEPRSGASTPTFREDDNNSPTASILDSMEQTAEDQPVAGAVVGLKRNTSAEVSRLRGPRGARGPRPAPGRIVSGVSTPPPIAEPEVEAPASAPVSAPEQERGGGVGVPGDYAPRKGKAGTSAGAVSGA